VLGVLEPGAAAACHASRAGRIAVIATESTVRGGAYQQAITRRLPRATVIARACPLFVALAEEGWTDGPVVDAVIQRYLDDIFVAGAPAMHPDTLVLGCTHFPVLAPAIASVLGDGVRIVDSAATTAASLVEVLAARNLGNPQRRPGSIRLLATDGAERFARVGAVFLGRQLEAEDVEIVDLPFASPLAAAQPA
jgi:glutamate racemase